MKKQKGLEWLDRTLMLSPYSYALCLSEKAYREELDRLCVPKKSRSCWIKTPQADATAHFLGQNGGIGMCIIVCLRKKKKVELEQVYGLLVHEATHIWQAIREYVGERYPGAESEAYAVQRISQSLMYSYRDQTAKKKKRSKV